MTLAQTYESWRLTRAELKKVFASYEKAVEEDVFPILHPPEEVRSLLGKQRVEDRASAVRRAAEANRAFFDAVSEDLPNLLLGVPELPSRQIAEVRNMDKDVPTLPTSSYGSAASIFLHLFRDWSAECAHVVESTYLP